MAFRAPGANESTNTTFTPAEADEYRCRIVKYTVKSGDDTRSKYNPDGREVVWFYLEPLHIEGDEEADMVDTSGKPIAEDKTFLFFFDPYRLGLKPQVSRSRKFLASALGIPVDQPVEADSLDAMCRDLIDREMVCVVEVNANNKNVITDTRPVRRKERRNRDRAPLVEAAKEAFGDDLKSADDADF